jgi:NADH:ubiquinone oxidoreductase subunit 2 (subunit N)
VIAMLSAGVAVFFYLRVVLTMFSHADASSDHALDELSEAGGGGTSVLTKLAAERSIELSPWMLTGLVIVLGATVVLGIWPQPLVSFAHQASLLF